MNNKKIVLPLVAVIVLLIAGVAYLAYNLNQEKQVNKDMQELAVLEKQEMENEYQQFADQYSEMKTRINNDSIINQLTREQERTKQLLEELRQTKANDAAEITRLKKELATVRAVLRSYVLQIDSLNQLNAELMDENNRVRSELEYTNQQNMALASSNMTLSEKVAIASQLNATNISLMPLNKRGKNNKTMKKARSLQVAFNIARNVTAANGTREIFIRVTNPMGEVLNGGGSFTYENRQLAYTMKRTIDYSGEETSITATWTVNETLPGGSYNVSIFADGNMIGSRNFTFEK
jgi:myosin heavy subunit